MSADVNTIFHRVSGFGVTKVEVEPEVQQGDFKGTRIVVYRANGLPADFFFPDYANMSDAEMAEVVANNLREEKWNSLRP